MATSTSSASKKAAGADEGVFQSEGYEPHVAFNALHGGERLLFFDNDHGRQVDLFVGCLLDVSQIPLDGRLEVDPVSIPLAELLLTKLQVVELNEKDVRDALALLHDHRVADADGESVNGARVAELCAADWGLWRTITQNLTACRGFANAYTSRTARPSTTGSSAPRADRGSSRSRAGGNAGPDRRPEALVRAARRGCVKARRSRLA